jgi:UPF0755 protein
MKPFDKFRALAYVLFKKMEPGILNKLICGTVILAGLLLACIALAAAYLFSDLTGYAQTAAGGRARLPAPWERIVVLPAGEGFSGLVKEIVDAGVVSDPRRFRRLARVLGVDRRMKAGEYRFSSAMSPLEILTKTARGDVLLHGMTIPEGWTVREIAALAGEKGIGDARDLLGKALSPEYAAAKGIGAETLEGYLYPDTYYFPRNTPADRIIQTMLARFEEVFVPSWTERARSMNLSRHQVVTLASIIEKETGAARERPVISSVFHNRMRRGMRLQSDPTVIYGIADFDGNITRIHLDAPSPYNTYRIDGLPPGPIASPGKASLEAALFPEETAFLYFVSRGDGTHHFSASLEAHNEAVRRYQLGGNRTGESNP